MLDHLDGLWWLLLLLGPLLILQRSLHREIQVLFLVVTRRPDISIAVFSLLFFPGVLLHESSHYLMARLLGVRTGRFSLLPRSMDDGRLQLGFVETASSDWFRDALIGGAPLLAGGMFVAYAGLNRLGLLALWETLALQGRVALKDVLSNMIGQADFWLWFYLTLIVSSTMLPSAADRRAWLPLGFFVALLLGASILAGAGPWMVEHLADPMNRVLQAVSVVFSISVLLHLVFLPPIWALRRLLAWAMGVQVA